MPATAESDARYAEQICWLTQLALQDQFDLIINAAKKPTGKPAAIQRAQIRDDRLDRHDRRRPVLTAHECTGGSQSDPRYRSSAWDRSNQPVLLVHIKKTCVFENRMDIQVFEVVLEPDADLGKAGEALAEASELAG